MNESEQDRPALTPRAQGLTRRALLRRAGGLAAAAALLPLQVRRALALKPARPGRFSDIKHIVLLMQENRSFDHYFGTLAGVRGFGDPHAMILKASGRTVFHQPDPKSREGYLLPFHLDTRGTSAQRLPTTDHSWLVQHLSWNRGHMDNWVGAHRDADGADGPYCMGYFTREDIPFHFSLAESFTLCDHYFSSVMGPTNPNRMCWMTGTIDADGLHGGPVINKYWPAEGYRWTTYAERLEAAGISWKVYQQRDHYDCNMLEKFRTFQDARRGSPLFERGMRHGGDDEFEFDAKNGRLPAVSWIIPTAYESEHPDHAPADGAAFIARKLAAIASNPEVWTKTLFVLNYDENDGLFDHVAPPVAPFGTPGEYALGTPSGAGFRVPCLLVSPWTAGGWVASGVFDHTSVLRLLEKFTGVREPNISDWRRKTFGDLSSALRFGEPAREPPPLPAAEPRGWQLRFDDIVLPLPRVPAGGQPTPAQERSRPHRKT
jgi:phospholipase C